MIQSVAKKYTQADIFAASPTTTLKIEVAAEDYAVGTLANGAAITNRFNNNALTLSVVGASGIAVQVNAEGRKEFVFDGTVVFECSDQNTFAPFHQNNSWSVNWVGKIGTTSNPDAFYGICGNSAGGSANVGMACVIENRVAQPSTQGFQHLVSRSASGQYAYQSIFPKTGIFNVRQSIWLQHTDLIMDQDRFFINSQLWGVKDRRRSTANSTSGPGTVYAINGGNPTYKFQIGSAGNNSSRMVGTLERFVLILAPASQSLMGQLDSQMGIGSVRGTSNLRYLRTHKVINNGAYVFGGMYSKKSDKTKNEFVSSTGPNHFNPANDREGIKTLSVDDGYNWPSYTTQWTNASEAIHGGVSGGRTPTGRVVAMYGKYTVGTGAYLGLFVRYSDDDCATWSSEYSVTIPTTSPQINIYIAHDKIEVAHNGDLMITWYGFVTTPSNLYKIYIARSTDNGATWSNTEVFSSTTRYVNESCVCSFGSSFSNKGIVISRVEAIDSGSYKAEIFKTTDDFATFSSLGTTNFGVTLGVYAHPFMCRLFDLDGTKCLAWYFRDRDLRRSYVLYTTVSNFDTNGISAFSGAPTYQLDIPSKSTYVSGYPFWVHPDGDLKFEGVYFDEVSSSNTDTYFFKVDDSHKATLKTALGI